jgi:hypothetical protein
MIIIESKYSTAMGHLSQVTADRDLANNGQFIMKWGSEGEADGKLSAVESIVVDSNDNIYMADFGNQGFGNHH